VRKGTYSSLAPEVQLRFRQAVELFVFSRVDVLGAETAYVKNKLALVIGLLIQADYPDRWPTAFDDFLSAVGGGSVLLIEMFLRVLTVLDEEVVQSTVNSSSDNHARYTRIKDTMRSSGVTNRISQFWLAVLSTYAGTQPALVEQCLQTIHLYIAWIDIGLVVNDRFVPLLLGFLAVPALRSAACSVFLGVVNKGMDDAAKVQLIATLQIVEALSALKLDFRAEDDAGTAVSPPYGRFNGSSGLFIQCAYFAVVVACRVCRQRGGTCLRGHGVVAVVRLCVRCDGPFLPCSHYVDAG
jgi:hypothetical protein